MRKRDSFKVAQYWCTWMQNINTLCMYFFLIWLMLTAIFYFSDSRSLLYLYSLQLYHYTADIMLQYGANYVRICSVIFTSIAHESNFWKHLAQSRCRQRPTKPWKKFHVINTTLRNVSFMACVWSVFHTLAFPRK